jgi:hypothetical protein
MVKGGSPNSLVRLGFNKSALPPGSEVVVEGFQARDGSKRAVGQVVQFADGAGSFLADRRRALAVRSRISSSSCEPRGAKV